MKRSKRSELKFRRTNKKTYFTKGLFLALLATSFFVLCFLYISKEEIKRFSTISFLKKEKVETLDKIDPEIVTILNNYSDIDASINLVLPNGSKKVFGSSDAYIGAITTKVLTAVYFLHQVEAGKESLDKYAGNYTYRWHLKQMINQSNNDSWEILNTKLGYRNLENYAHSIGMSSFDVNTNTVTAADMTLLLQKLSNGELIDSNNRDLLYIFMQKTNNENLIAAAMPEGATIYHKYGNLDYNLHDIAIINYKGKQIILTIYTDTDKAVVADRRIQFFRDITTAIMNSM